jgi:hypothetical protein
VIKGDRDHPRVENARDVPNRFQSRTPFLRPLIDEIEEPFSQMTIALRYLESDLLSTSVTKALNRKELKHVSRCILEAFKTFHRVGHVHTGISRL